MNRRVLFQVTLPASVIGTILVGTCLFSAWSIDRLQSNFSFILSENVTSLEAAQDLEIQVRQLRYHSFLNWLDPKPDRLESIENDEKRFEVALELARGSSNSVEERDLIKRIDQGYQRYHAELAQMQREFAKDGPRANLGKLSDKHPIRHVVEPCQELLKFNKASMVEIAHESDRLTGQAHLAMIVLGVLGPIGGLIIGFGIARGLSRSISQLSVRVQDMARHLDQNAGSVSVATDGDLQDLDRQLQDVVHRVEETALRLQRQQFEMLRAVQLAAVGQLAAGVAHEVRNPLTAIKMLVEAALRPSNIKPLTPQDLRVIHGEIVRLEQRVQGLLDFARLPTPRRVLFDLREIVGEATDLIRARARQQHVEVAVALPEHSVSAFLDREQVRTVLVNILMNALDAMPHGGQLEVDMTQATPARTRLRISDTGSGISPEIASRLFTPFASTRPTGTGLGLSISRRIIDEHGGSIVAENRPASGACFTVELPTDLANAFHTNGKFLA